LVSSSSTSSAAVISHGGRNTTVRILVLSFSCILLIPHADVLAAGLDSGLAISIILIFFCLQYPANGTIGSTNIATWWGNTVFLNTADGQGLSYYTINGTFGPSKW
jgi:hypothetical protein